MTIWRYCRLFTLPIEINKVVPKERMLNTLTKRGGNVEGGEGKAHLAPPRAILSLSFSNFQR